MTIITTEQAQKLLDEATPGPWRSDDAAVRLEDKSLVALVYGNGRGLFSANARLIAAAPDLARALLDTRAELAQARADTADIVRSVWGRCEALEDEAADKLAQLEKLTDHEKGFWRGQKTVAKSIRRSTEMPTAEAIAIRRAEGGKA